MRIRTVKPEFWTDEQMSSVSDFARLLALALLNYSDDEGYFLSNPILIRGACFPFLDDSKKIQRAIQELSKIEFIELGELSDGRGVGRIPSFRKHQRIDKPQVSKMKQNSQFQEHSKNDPRMIQESSETILGGNGKGMEGEIEKEQGKGERKGLAHPELSEVLQFCKDKGYRLFDAVKYFNLRVSNDWVNAKGRRISNWKNDINTQQAFDSFRLKLTAEELENEAMLKFAEECGKTL